MQDPSPLFVFFRGQTSWIQLFFSFSPCLSQGLSIGINLYSLSEASRESSRLGLEEGETVRARFEAWDCEGDREREREREREGLCFRFSPREEDRRGRFGDGLREPDRERSCDGEEDREREGERLRFAPLSHACFHSASSASTSLWSMVPLKRFS